MFEPKNYPLLSTTPIKEIIFTISYSDSIPIEALTKFRQTEEIYKKFKFVGDGFIAKFTANTVQDGPKASILKDGLVLRCSEEDKVIQAREGSFSFHKVNGYESFEKLLPQFISYWKIFLDCIGGKDLTINNISLRYLNFIELQVGESFSNISHIKASNPFVEDLTKYLIRLQFVNDEYKNVIIGLVQAPTKRSSVSGLMLDTNLNQTITEKVGIDLLEEYLRVMRNIKNDVFFRTITDEAIKRYL